MEEKENKKAERAAKAFAISIGTLIFGGFMYLGGVVLTLYKFTGYAPYMYNAGIILAMCAGIALVASGMMYIFGGFD